MTAMDLLLVLELLILFCAGIFWVIGESLGRTNPEDQLRRSMRLFFRELWQPTTAGADFSDDSIPLDEPTATASSSSRGSRGLSTPDDVSSLDVEVIQDDEVNGIMGFSGNLLRIRVTSDPLGGEANRVVADLLAAAAAMPVYNIKLVRGHYQARKAIKLTGISQAELRAKLSSF